MRTTDIIPRNCSRVSVVVSQCTSVSMLFTRNHKFTYTNLTPTPGETETRVVHGPRERTYRVARVFTFSYYSAAAVLLWIRARANGWAAGVGTPTRLSPVPSHCQSNRLYLSTYLLFLDVDLNFTPSRCFSFRLLYRVSQIYSDKTRLRRDARLSSEQYFTARCRVRIVIEVPPGAVNGSVDIFQKSFFDIEIYGKKMSIDGCKNRMRPMNSTETE